MEKKEILIIDDEENILKALTREINTFIEKETCLIKCFESPILALEYIEKEYNKIAVIISDQRMPEMKGNELLLIVKERYPDIVSIILTAYTDINEINTLIKAGIFSFLVKPWETDYLRSEIFKALQHYNLIIENKNYLKMIKEELRWGGELQKTLLQREIPKSDRIEFFVTYTPLPELNCGGDYYDIIFINENLYLLLIGDVAGHGIKAAFITAILKSVIFSGYVSKNRNSSFSPADFLCWLNNRLCDEFQRLPGMLVTFMVCLIDMERCSMMYAGAGQHPGLIIRDSKIYSFHSEGISLGVQKNSSYAEKNVSLKGGDKIVLFSDGLNETGRMNQENINIKPFLLKYFNSPDYNEKVIEDIKNHFPQKKFLDDITFISIDIKTREPQAIL